MAPLTALARLQYDGCGRGRLAADLRVLRHVPELVRLVRLNALEALAGLRV